MIYTTAAVKGGCGKSTTCAALAQAAAADGKKALIIDLDPQGNTSFFMGADLSGPGSFDLFNGSDARAVIQATAQGVDVIAGTLDLATVKTGTGSAKRLAKAIAPIKEDYDYIFIDPAPAVSDLTYNALYAADRLLIPIEADNSNLQGLRRIVQLAQQIGQYSPLQIAGTVITRYDARPKLNRFYRDTIAQEGERIGSPVIAEIRNGIAVKEAQAFKESLFDYAPKSKPAQDYQALYEKLKERE